MDVPKQRYTTRRQYLGQGFKGIEREAIVANPLALLVSAHGVFDPLADGFQAIANMNLDFAHGSPALPFERRKKSPHAIKYLMSIHDICCRMTYVRGICPRTHTLEIT